MSHVPQGVPSKPMAWMNFMGRWRVLVSWPEPKVRLYQGRSWVPAKWYHPLMNFSQRRLGRLLHPILARRLPDRPGRGIVEGMQQFIMRGGLMKRQIVRRPSRIPA